MKKVNFAALLFLTPLLLILLSSGVSAHGSTLVQLGFTESELIGLNLPSFARSLFGNQRINLYIPLNSGEQKVGGQEIHGIVIKKGVITQFGETELESPTLQVFASETAVTEIVMAENQPAELQKALQEGSITYRAIGIKNKVKFRAARVLANVAGWFQK